MQDNLKKRSTGIMQDPKVHRTPRFQLASGLQPWASTLASLSPSVSPSLGIAWY